MGTKAVYRGGILNYFDSATQETVLGLGACRFKDDFLLAALDTNIWTALDTGDATESIVTDGNCGQIALALAATSEAELAGLSWNDHRPLVLNQGLVFETRIKLSVLPTTGTIVCAGLMGDHHATADTVAESIWFRWDGSTGGLITVETDDTSNETSKVTTGVTLTASDWTVLRIDCTTITDIKFYVNGNRVATGTTFTMAQVAALTLQPILRLNKASGTSVGTMLVDYVSIYQRRA